MQQIIIVVAVGNPPEREINERLCMFGKGCKIVSAVTTVLVFGEDRVYTTTLVLETIPNENIPIKGLTTPRWAKKYAELGMHFLGDFAIHTSEELLALGLSKTRIDCIRRYLLKRH